MSQQQDLVAFPKACAMDLQNGSVENSAASIVELPDVVNRDVVITRAQSNRTYAKRNEFGVWE
jgi:hypothetical protein